jgi:hypothetical protein
MMRERVHCPQMLTTLQAGNVLLLYALRVERAWRISKDYRRWVEI